MSAGQADHSRQLDGAGRHFNAVLNTSTRGWCSEATRIACVTAAESASKIQSATAAYQPALRFASCARRSCGSALMAVVHRTSFVPAQVRMSARSPFLGSGVSVCCAPTAPEIKSRKATDVESFIPFSRDCGDHGVSDVGLLGPQTSVTDCDAVTAHASAPKADGRGRATDCAARKTKCMRDDAKRANSHHSLSNRPSLACPGAWLEVQP